MTIFQIPTTDSPFPRLANSQWLDTWLRMTLSNDSRRVKVAHVLQEFGYRLQLSVFELDLEPDDLRQLRRRVGPLLARSDRFELVPVDLRPDRTRLSWKQEVPVRSAITFL